MPAPKTDTRPPYYQSLNRLKDEDRQIWKIAYFGDGQILSIESFYKPVSRLIDHARLPLPVKPEKT